MKSRIPLERGVWFALNEVLAPLTPYGFTLGRQPEGVDVSLGGASRYVSARELIDCEDACAYVAEVFDL
jgi:hypothetical protein